MPGKINISYNGYVGIQQPTYLPDFVDAAGYMEMVNSAIKILEVMLFILNQI